MSKRTKTALGRVAPAIGALGEQDGCKQGPRKQGSRAGQRINNLLSVLCRQDASHQDGQRRDAWKNVCPKDVSGQHEEKCRSQGPKKEIEAFMASQKSVPNLLLAIHPTLEKESAHKKRPR